MPQTSDAPDLRTGISVSWLIRRLLLGAMLVGQPTPCVFYPLKTRWGGSGLWRFTGTWDPHNDAIEFPFMTFFIPIQK